MIIIVAYTVSRDKSAKTRLISLKEGVKNEFHSIFTPQELDLIVDGGGENNNARIYNFMRHCEVKINKKIALKEVHFSNSMIEGNNKILKKFLRIRGPIYSYSIQKEIDFFFKDHNEHKPSYHFQIHTPSQLHDNPILSHVKPILQQVNKARLEANRSSCCKN